MSVWGLRCRTVSRLVPIQALPSAYFCVSAGKRKGATRGRGRGLGLTSPGGGLGGGKKREKWKINE